MGVRLFVGSHAKTVGGERVDLAGDRMFTSVYSPPYRPATSPIALLDSGAFTDAPTARLTPEQALTRQLTWEESASRAWGHPWQAFGVVSYDLLIDETWEHGKKYKRRWSIREADWATEQTIESAAYLASQREKLAPRTLVLSCQGVDAIQYTECTTEVLKHAKPGDWIGLGGWCILGQHTSLLPEFFTTCHQVLPRVANAGITHIHIFGVLWLPALGGLLWLADHYGLTVSTDSSAPILSCTRSDPKRAGVRAESGYWRDNVAWWQHALATLRTSRHYRRPRHRLPARQLSLTDHLEAA